MTLTTTFRLRGRDYFLSLDPAAAIRRHPNGGRVEWVVKAPDGRVIEVTAWRNESGKFSDGIAHLLLYESDGTDTADSTNILFREGKNNKDVPSCLAIHYIIRDYQRMFGERDSLESEVRKLRSKLEKRDKEIERLNCLYKVSKEKRRKLHEHFQAYIKRCKEKSAQGEE